MRIKHLFYVLLAMPLVFASCEQFGGDDKKPEEPKKEYAAELTLTSENTVEFEAAGGEGEITFTAKMVEVTRTAEEPAPEATCEAEWVTINTTDFEKCSFTVAANEGEARETKIVVTYVDKNIEVAVKQAAKADEPVVPIEVTMNTARRIGTAEFGYEVFSYDCPIIFEGDEYSALVYFVGAEEDTVLQAGEYSNADFSVYLAACALGNEEVEYELTEVIATVTVEGDVYGIDVTMTDVDGIVLHFLYEGEVEDMNPANNEPEAFTPAKVVASRLDTYPAGNFFLQFYVDDYRYHDIEMCDKVNPNENYLSSGKYTIADGTIGDWSTYSNGVNTTCKVSDAEITLVNNSDNSVTLVGFIKSEEGHYITIDWTGTVEGFKYETGGEVVNFTAQYFTYEHYDYDGVYNYYITLSDAAEEDVLGAYYYTFDLYSATLDTENPRVPVGTYTFDIEDSCEDGTMGVSWTYMKMTTTDGVVVWLGSKGGTLTVTETGLEATINYDDGSTHTITYTGDLSIDLPEPEPISSLTADVAVNVTNATIVTSKCYGDIYGTGAQYWLINIMEDATYSNGVYIQLDLLATSNESYVGTYTASNLFGAGTFTPGIVGDYGNASSWYYDMYYGNNQAWAPLADGTITVADNGDGSMSFTFDCTDGLGHAIKGTITAR